MKNQSILGLMIDHEARILIRNRALLILVVTLVAVLLASLWTGYSLLQNQRQTIVKVQQSAVLATAEVKDTIRAINRRDGFYPGDIWDDPTYPYNFSRDAGIRYAIKSPIDLQVLNSGQSDIQPYYYKVNPRVIQALTHTSEIENSYVQFLGGFNFAFVVIYLLPLLIIVFSYNVLSQEKEQGTWVLLKTSNQSIARLILYRILIRYGIFSLLFWLVVLAAMLVMIGPAFLATANWWWLMVIVSLYMAFWFGLAYWINSFSQPSTVNALLLVLVWLVTTLLIPNGEQIVLNRTYPVPSRISMLNDEREAVNEFYKKEGGEISRNLIDNPLSMIRTVNVITPELVYGYGVMYYTRLAIIEKAALTVKKRLEDQLARQQRAIQRWMFISPALMLQEYLSALTGTHAEQFSSFTRDVEKFETEQQQFYVPLIKSRDTYHHFTVDEVDKVPRFKTGVYHVFDWIHIEWGAVFYSILLVGMCLLGYRNMQKLTR